MPLEFKNQSQLLAEAYERLINNTNITNLAPGGTARAILEIITELQANQNLQLQNNVLQAFVSRANGHYLDLLGEMFGISRLNATYAIDRSKTNFRFFIDPATGLSAADLRINAANYLTTNSISDSNILADGFLIPQGITVSTPGGVSYTTLQTAQFTGPDTEVFIDILANDIGELGQVGAYQLTQHNIVERSPGFGSVAPLILCTNSQPITNGEERETDQNLRFRISQASVGAANANETAVRLAVLSVPGVRDIRLRPYTFGIGTFSVFVLGEHPIVSDGLLNAAKAAAQNIAAAGIRVIVERPTIRTLQLSLTTKFLISTARTERTSIIRQIRNAIINYINNIPIGGEFIINELIQRAMDVSENIKDLKIQKLSSGFFDVSSSKTRQLQPLLIANQIADWDEQFYTNNTFISVCEA